MVSGDRTIGGRQFKDGQLFPYREMGLVEFRAVALWKAGRLKVAEPGKAPSVDHPHPVIIGKPTLREQGKRSRR